MVAMTFSNFMQVTEKKIANFGNHVLHTNSKRFRILLLVNVVAENVIIKKTTKYRAVCISCVF